MAEATRRKDVRPFRHMMLRGSSGRPFQLGLFDAAAQNASRIWNCAARSGVAVPVGQVVTIEKGEQRGLIVTWGNEAIATIGGLEAVELLDGMSFSNQKQLALPAIVVALGPGGDSFDIQLTA